MTGPAAPLPTIERPAERESNSLQRPSFPHPKPLAEQVSRVRSSSPFRKVRPDSGLA